MMANSSMHCMHPFRLVCDAVLMPPMGLIMLPKALGKGLVREHADLSMRYDDILLHAVSQAASFRPSMTPICPVALGA